MESSKKGKQMTATVRSADAPFGRHTNWKSINWRQVRDAVRRLQVRIAKAVKEKKLRKARSLQWILTHSYYAKLWAIKRVTSNKGKRTPGVDGVVWTASRQKLDAVKLLKRRGYRPLPLRRIYIPKKNKSEKRPLSIPTMNDRACQALYKLALEPVAETLADPNSYGFRIWRRCADAIGQCFNTLAKGYSPIWILEADIRSCFDEISHSWMLDNILMDREVLRKWLKAGYMEKGSIYPTTKGTPQGGIASPTLANMALDGLEAAAKKAAPARIDGDKRSKINVIRYADDFVISGDSKELLETKVKPAVEAFLHERGLSLSEAKTRIVRIDEGFDFLGQNIRKYNGKLMIKPARKNVKAFLRDIRKTIRKHLGLSTISMIGQLNPKIRGWANYHRYVVSGKIFSYIDTCIYNSLWQWMKRRHRNKSKTWMKNKYWLNGSKPWMFSTRVKDKRGYPRLYEVIRACHIGIVRHIKIRGNANPFDPKYDVYFRKRRFLKTYGQRTRLVGSFV
jgi:RNA-directed DNA polymerase